MTLLLQNCFLSCHSEIESNPNLIHFLSEPSFASFYLLVQVNFNVQYFLVNPQLPAQNLPSITLNPLLTIFNYLLITSTIFNNQTLLKIIPIPKINLNLSSYTIALYSTLNKVFKSILKNRLDWWLQSNSILSNSLYVFRKRRETIQYLA